MKKTLRKAAYGFAGRYPVNGVSFRAGPTLEL